tara:strand:- start:1445 stop:2596 length:1152 start_codon:yes stop_codon:yes gene_type:complete
MKQLSKMMLAVVASVAFATSAYAWDFSASGSASAQWSQSTIKASTDADAVTGSAVADSGGAISIVSSHTDGANSATLTYKIDYDGGLDEGFTLSGSKTVGAWTASAATNHQKLNNGAPATGEDETNITLTDGTMTIVLGGAAHLASQNVSSGSVAGGDSINMDGATADYNVGAFVGTFKGVSLGYKVNDTTTATLALEMSGSDNDTMGSTASWVDGETAVFGQSGSGVGVTTVLGPAAVGFTFATSSSSDPTGASSASTAFSTMGLGVKLDLGDIDPFLSYGVASTVGSECKCGMAVSASEVGLTYAMGSDSIVLFLGNSATISTADGTAGEADAWSAMEVGYTTAVGPAALGIGYGTLTKNQTGGTEGYAASYMEAQLDLSF